MSALHIVQLIRVTPLPYMAVVFGEEAITPSCGHPTSVLMPLLSQPCIAFVCVAFVRVCLRRADCAWVCAASSWYRRAIPRNDTGITQAVPWLLAVPSGGVSITGGPLQGAFEGNIVNYLHLRDPLDMLYFFAVRAGVQVRPSRWCVPAHTQACSRFTLTLTLTHGFTVVFGVEPARAVPHGACSFPPPPPPHAFALG